jgi:LacI family transcriptional regulator
VNAERDAIGPPAAAISARASATPGLDDVAAAIAEILSEQDRGRRPDALICTSGRLTLGAVHALRTAGVRIPDDLAFVTFDDFPWAALNDPPLTVVDQRPHEMGVRATELILTEPDHDEPVEIVIPPALLVRRSCGFVGGPG